MRDAIVDDQNEMITKINVLARKNLNASYFFLKEGIETLHLALDEVEDEQICKDEANADQDGSKTRKTTTRNESEPEVLNEAIELLAGIYYFT